jgi:hypothetical protein
MGVIKEPIKPRNESLNLKYSTKLFEQWLIFLEKKFILIPSFFCIILLWNVYIEQFSLKCCFQIIWSPFDFFKILKTLVTLFKTRILFDITIDNLP